MKNFWIRTASGAIYVLIIIFAIYGVQLINSITKGSQMDINSFFFCPIFFAITIIASCEIVKNLRLRGETVDGTMAIICSAATYLFLSPIFIFYLDSLIVISFLIPLLPFVIMMKQLWRHDEHPFATIGYTMLPTLWVAIPLLILSHIDNYQPNLVMMLFILIWVNDSFAYMTGKLLGRHKMWERHSPGKTWEGTIGGALFCIAVAFFVGPLIVHEPQSRIHWIVLAVIVSVVGTLGDLTESLFKRSCGVKDSGNIMPGHGGMLDRFDSILMATPFVFFYLLCTIPQ